MKSKRVLLLSLVIPVYNEEARLIEGLNSVLAYLTKQPYTWELFLVDDGSATSVRRLLEKKKKELAYALSKLPVSVYRLPHNQGKGSALRMGVAKARGKYIVFSDIDLSVPISSLRPMLSKLPSHPVVIASRRVSGSRIVVHQQFLRESGGRIFTSVSNMLCGVNVADATCGFKGFHRDTAKRLFGTARVNRWVFDTEILFLARQWGVPIYELPVSWYDRKGSKVKLGDTVGALLDVFRIRIYHVLGYYRSPYATT